MILYYIILCYVIIYYVIPYIISYHFILFYFILVYCIYFIYIYICHICIYCSCTMGINLRNPVQLIDTECFFKEDWEITGKKKNLETKPTDLGALPIMIQWRSLIAYTYIMWYHVSISTVSTSLAVGNDQLATTGINQGRQMQPSYLSILGLRTPDSSRGSAKVDSCPLAACPFGRRKAACTGPNVTWGHGSEAGKHHIRGTRVRNSTYELQSPEFPCKPSRHVPECLEETYIIIQQ